MSEGIRQILFFITIFLSNILQGVTGFAGPVLAMPFSILLVGYDTARPVLNAIGVAAGLCLMLEGIRYVRWKTLLRVVLNMAVGTGMGMLIRRYAPGSEGALKIVFALFAMGIAVRGVVTAVRQKRREKAGAADALPVGPEMSAGKRTAIDCAMLVGAGVAHGLFVSGGPLLVGFLTRNIDDTKSFRATLSAVWVILNGVVLVDDALSGVFTQAMLARYWPALPALLLAILIGTLLARRIRRETFLLLTFGLLFVSGATLLLR